MASANGSKAKETQESGCSERTIDHLSLLKSMWILTCTHQNDCKICLTCDRTHTRSSIREITWKRAFFDVTIEEHYHTQNNGNHFLTIFYQQTRQTRIKRYKGFHRFLCKRQNQKAMRWSTFMYSLLRLIYLLKNGVTHPYYATCTFRITGLALQEKISRKNGNLADI